VSRSDDRASRRRPREPRSIFDRYVNATLFPGASNVVSCFPGRAKWLFGFWQGAPLTEDTRDKGTLDEVCRRLLRDAFRSAMNPDP
jgi:hypothetical protein